MISNPNGIFYVGNTKHRVVGDVINIEITDPKTKATTNQSYNYVVSCESEFNSKALKETQLASVEYEGDKRKVFARVNVLYYYIYNSAQNMATGEYVLQFHCSAQKKSLFGWNSYPTEFTIESLSYYLAFGPNEQTITDFVSKGGRFASQALGPFDSPELMNYYLDFSIKTFQNYGQTTPALQKHAFRFRARSRGTGDCGAIMNDSYFFNGIEIFTNCR